MNLLPIIEKRAVTQEYYRRLAVVALIFVALLFFVILISIIVSYISSTYEIMSLERDVVAASRSNIIKGVAVNMNTVKDANNKLDILTQKSAQDFGYDISAIFSSIINSSKVSLTSFTYDQVAVKKGQIKEIGYRVTVGGVAKDREALHNFVKSLETDKRFLSVDLPISSLIESRDLNFVITIMVAKK